MANRIYSFCSKMIVWIGGLILATLAVLAIFEQAYVVLDGSEAVLFLDKGVRFWILLLFAFVFTWGLCKKIDIIPENILFILGAIIYIVLGTSLILSTQPMLRADAAYIFDFAIKAKQGNFEGLAAGGYFFRNPHQLGFALYEIIFSFVSENVLFFYFLNLLWVILIQYVQWKISRLIFEDKPVVRKICLVISFLFCPMLFFILFVYGQIPGLLCVISSFYFFVKFMKQEKTHDFILVLFLGMFAVLLKQNYQISILAMMILLCIKWIGKWYECKKRLKYPICLFLLLLALFMPGACMKAGFGIASGMEINDGVPNILYVDMGLQDDPNHPALGGWSNGYIWYRYEDCNFDNEVAFRRSLTSIHASAIRLCESPEYFAKFFYEKIVSTWCDPMFGSVWAGPIEKIGYNNSPGIVADIYAGKEVYFALADMSNVLVVIIYLGGFCGCMINKDKKQFVGKEELLYPVLFLIGGFLCHVFWETKSQYVYTYVFLMIPMASGGLCDVMSTLQRKGLGFDRTRQM